MRTQCVAAISEEYVLDKSKISNACLVLVVGVLLLLITSDQIWSRSVDLAHHYALVERLLEPGGVGSSRDPSLGEMQFYPRAAHLIATVVARLFDSAIVGVALTATASLIGGWIAIAYLLSGFGRPVATRVLWTTAASLLIGGGILRLQIFGKEIVGSYFFSQLVAQAALYVVMAIALRLERRSIARWLRYGFLAAAILSIESIHLLPAIEGLGFLGLLLLADVIESWSAGTPTRTLVRSLVVPAIFLVATTVAVIAHPTFAVMRSISENNGDLPLTLFRSMAGLFVLALVVLGLSIALVFRWIRLANDSRQSALPLKYIGALGASCTVLFLLQWLAWHFGQGSEYACKKYVFALATTLLLELPLFLVASPTRLNAVSKLPRATALGLKDSLAMIGIIVAGFFSAAPLHNEVSVSSIRKLERDVKAMQAFRLQHGITGTAIAAHLSAPSPVLDYMFSIATLKAPRDETTLDLLRNSTPTGLAHLSMIVTARNDPTYDVQQCRVPTGTETLVGVDAQCFVTAKNLNSTCHDLFDLTSAGAIEPTLLSGFSSPEPGGTWTDATNASFRCEMPLAGASRSHVVEVTVSAFVPADHPQRLTLSLGDSPTRDTVTFTRPGEVKVVTLPIGGASSGWVSLRFSMPDAVSPAQAGLSADARLLGVQVSAIRFR
jgi:hypothetical protein